ncbi:MAG: peptidoglycan DD-metalloendopeptidase family protein [Desulfuromonadales bacterium]|nr:peptidoglycan DD-metalloendopeptidase family protein [Desulfuromonadales bacterium]
MKTLERKKSVLLKKQQQQQQVAEKGRLLQARLLRQARKDKTKLAQEIAQLKKNAASLRKLIVKLEQQPKTVAAPQAVAGSFALGRGKLGWPVNGRVSIGFGKKKDSKLGTYYDSNGLEIAVPAGSPIRSVAAGKVVFADYFKGYGNLYIISHPGGYHTLYAQTDKMKKELNDNVAAGDILGYSGLGGRDSIYFEIRSKGSPVNPLSWLIKK